MRKLWRDYAGDRLAHYAVARQDYPDDSIAARHTDFMIAWWRMWFVALGGEL